MPFPSRGTCDRRRGTTSNALTAALAATFAGLTLAPPALSGQSATDIVVLELESSAEGVRVGEAIRVTDRDGYDNQPAFIPGEDALLYTTIDAAGVADIRRYDFATGSDMAVTTTAPESEYSATPIPGSIPMRFSAIRVEADSTQRLWSFRMDGSDARVLLPDIAPVGYHAWADEETLGLFVLGQPATLQIATVGEGEGRIVARNIGRALQPVPGRRAVSYLQLPEEPFRGQVVRYDLDTGALEPLVSASHADEYHAWTPDGTLLTVRGSTLLRWRDGMDEWEEVADLSDRGIQAGSRLAVSPDGRRLAIVIGR